VIGSRASANTKLRFAMIVLPKASPAPVENEIGYAQLEPFVKQAGGSAGAPRTPRTDVAASEDVL
jgi:hypothetical protein